MEEFYGPEDAYIEGDDIRLELDQNSEDESDNWLTEQDYINMYHDECYW